MADLTGVSAQLAYAKEGTKNTRETPDHWVYFENESLKLERPWIPAGGLGGARRLPRVGAQGNQMIGGSVAIPLVPEGMGEFLELCIGDVSTSAGPPYDHEITPGELHSGTVQVGKPGLGGTVHPFDFVGCMVNSWSLAFNADGDGENAMLQAELWARQLLTDQTLATPSYPTVTQLTSLQASLTIDDGGGADAVCVRSFNLDCNNNLRRVFEACAAGPGLAVITENGQRDYSGSLVADFDDLTLYALYVAGTPCTLELTISDSSSAELVVAAEILFTGEGPEVSGPEVLDQPLSFMLASDTDDASALTVTLTNGDSAP